MMLKIYCFFDRVSGQYMPQLMLLPNNEVALRGVKKLVNSPQFPHRDIAEDLQFFCLGSMNIDNGVIVPDVQFMLNVIDIMEVKKDVQD